jgi:hypothetical protein
MLKCFTRATCFNPTKGPHQAGIVMKLKMAIDKQLAYLWEPVGTPAIYVLPFSISLIYQPEDGPLVGLKHVALVKAF